MIDIKHISAQKLQNEPFHWGAISDLYTSENATAIATSFPHDHFKTVTGNDGEKKYEYESRCLIGMGKDEIAHPEELSVAWLELANDLKSPAYRDAISKLTGHDLTNSSLEVNLFHYGPGASLGPHLDLATKIVTHAIYFNRWWNGKDGGCLTILSSSAPDDVAAEILPIVGNSAIIVRSEKSWHAVSRVVDGCNWSRRSLTATFYHPGSPSTMWPANDLTPLHRFDAKDM